MAQTPIRLDHLNLPARDPQTLARWYADTFGLQADRHLVRGPGVLIAFQAGEPVNRAPEMHIGLRVPSVEDLKGWAAKFGQEITRGQEFLSFRTSDPDGNCIELYCKPD